VSACFCLCLRLRMSASTCKHRQAQRGTILVEALLRHGSQVRILPRSPSSGPCSLHFPSANSKSGFIVPPRPKEIHQRLGVEARDCVPYAARQIAFGSRTIPDDILCDVQLLSNSDCVNITAELDVASYVSTTAGFICRMSSSGGLWRWASFAIRLQK
jgi:hypothetical protein